MKTKELKNFNYFGISKTGKVREENQDRIDYFTTVNGDVLILCDGMGGLTAGDFSAEKTIGFIKEFLQKEWKEDPLNLLNDVIKYANTELVKLLKSNNLYKKSGTTLVIVLIRENRLFYAHVGDSRIYYRTGSKVFKVTKDHSYIQGLLDKNLITESELNDHPRRNEITKAIGISEIVEPEICKRRIKPSDGDFIMLCSDGFSSFIFENEINSILKEDNTVKEKIKKLYKKAEKNGSDDNISIQLVHFYNTGNQKTEGIQIKDDNKKRKSRYKFYATAGIAILTILVYFLFNIINVDSADNKNLNYNEQKGSAVQVFKLPDCNKGIFDTLTVKADMNIYQFSEMYSISVEEILKLNNKTEIFLMSGEKIIIICQ